MFDNRLIPNGMYVPDYPIANQHAILLTSARNQFSRARQGAFFERIRCLILRRFFGLRDLSSLPRKQVRSQHYGGRKTVPLDKICGTLGRTSDFDCRFHPRSESMRDRWVSVAIARLQYIPLEPVKLIQVGEYYFVEDGHHRISVARARDEFEIEAEVTVWEWCGPLPWETQTAVRALPQIA